MPWFLSSAQALSEPLRGTQVCIVVGAFLLRVPKQEGLRLLLPDPHLFLPLSLFHFFLEFHDVYVGFSVRASIALSAGESGGRWLVHTVGITVLPGLGMEAQGLLLSPENLCLVYPPRRP